MANPSAHTGKPHVRIGDLLIQAGRITQAQLDDAVRLQQRTGERLGSALVLQGLTTLEEVHRCIGAP